MTSNERSAPDLSPQALNQLKTLIAETTDPAHYPMAADVQKGVPVYDCARLKPVLDDRQQRETLERELATNLLSGPGAYALRGAFEDPTVLDDATTVFETIIAEEKERFAGAADHFATPGANDRVWNSLEKLCLAAPQTFMRYHSNPWIDLAGRSWLGPTYQVTAQVNLVHPGGAAQEAHCDYHLGFMQAHQVAAYPAHVHAFSAQLTLQGAVAHCDMPIESGPTKLLPNSQRWVHNYTQFRHPDVRSLFEQHFVQVPLQQGDLLFFSPGLFHAAGDNRTTDVHRMANLLQISSPFGRPIEAVDRTAMCRIVYPQLRQGTYSAEEQEILIASTAEGYAFPTNLDTDPSVGGLAPMSQADLMRTALAENWDEQTFSEELDARDRRRSGQI